MTGNMIPNDPIKEVFSADTRHKWSCTNNPTESLKHRFEVLSACGPYPTDEVITGQLKWLRAKKAAWATYFQAAYACGMLDGVRGKDVRGRLVGKDDDGFRSAIAECMVCWFLAGHMKLEVNGVAFGRKKRELDMKVLSLGTEIGVEVKAPFREPKQNAWSGTDADKIITCIADSNKQFDDTCANLLVINPSLRTPMYSDRKSLMQGVYGENVIVFDVDLDKGETSNPRQKFSPQGKLLSTTRPNGKALKRDGLPAYRRISAVISIEERVVETRPFPINEVIAAEKFDCDRNEMFRRIEKKIVLNNSKENEMLVVHDVLVLHNPHAYHPVPESQWSRFPQMVMRNEKLFWTDNYHRHM